MFNESKYTRWYYDLILSAMKRVDIDGYFERHHIVPRSLGGDNSKENIVRLTAREHYVCHLLLTKMCIAPSHQYKMWCAALRVCTHSTKNGIEYYKNSKLYEAVKQKQAEECRLRMLGNSHKLGKKESGLTRQRKREAFAKSDTIGRWKRTAESISKFKVSRSLGSAGRGERNAMANPQNREKVALSKIGRKLFINEHGNRRFFFPGTEPIGYRMN